MSILIIEDDVNINSLLSEYLTKEGYICDSAYSGTEGVLLTDKNEYDIILLDLMLPGLNGAGVLSKIREKSNTPVIAITAKDSVDEKVDLFNLGADDYITKPFDLKEVAARILVQLRHYKKGSADKLYVHKNLMLDSVNYNITVCGKLLNKITKHEFAIMRLLMSNPTKVFTKEEIFEYAWEEIYMGETKTLDVHISNIRKKIREITDEEYIETVWGIGYKLQL